MEQMLSYLDNNLSNLYIPKPGIIDILEIAIISFVIYHILIWLRSTRAWFLMKGIVSIMVMFVIAVFFFLIIHYYLSIKLVRRFQVMKDKKTPSYFPQIYTGFFS